MRGGFRPPDFRRRKEQPFGELRCDEARDPRVAELGKVAVVLEVDLVLPVAPDVLVAEHVGHAGDVLRVEPDQGAIIADQ